MLSRKLSAFIFGGFHLLFTIRSSKMPQANTISVDKFGFKIGFSLKGVRGKASRYKEFFV